MLQYRRLKPSQALLRYLKAMHIRPGARVVVILNGKQFEARYEVMRF
jgi:hypothetical protein